VHCTNIKFQETGAIITPCWFGGRPHGALRAVDALPAHVGVLVAPLYICTVLFPASIFTFSFLNFMCSNFYLQPFLFLLNFLSRNFVSHLSPIFQSQNLLLGLFWLPNFFLYKNFAPRLFSSNFIDVKIF